jgi:hypothetical protein
MTTFKTYPMNNSAILRINAEKPFICAKPEYQRNSDVWTLEKRQLLIDSILNDYDIPKLYLHVLPQKKQIDQDLYAIIDGRQRLETIWSFIHGDFALAADFKFLRDPTIKAGGLTYADMAKAYPRLKIIFDGFTLPIILVDTDDIELIEEMFSRLNEAVPLNAAEKRNAIGGAMAKVIRTVAEHDLFKHKIRFSNKRYQHREAAAKLLFLESLNKSRIIDTKKAYLDDFVRRYKSKPNESNNICEFVVGVLDHICDLFINKDPLLKTQGMLTIYYLFFRDMLDEDKKILIKRADLVKFNTAIEHNRKLAEQDITKANFEMLEFDRMSQSGINDAASIKERLRIIKEHFSNYELKI